MHMSLIEIKGPDIGAFKEVEDTKLLVKAGDAIKVDQSLIAVESDKASMEIPSSHAGVIKALKVAVGDRVANGSIIASIEATAGASAPPPGPPPPPRRPPPPRPLRRRPRPRHPRPHPRRRPCRRRRCRRTSPPRRR